MTWNYRNRRRGFSLTELLVVMVIVGLLSTIAVPVYVNRMEEARVKMAMSEAREIGTAEEQCALFHGYYVPFQLLDDRPRFTGVASVGDVIDLEPNDIRLINPLIRPDVQRARGQETLAQFSTLPRVRELVEHWQGPFLTFQDNRVYTGGRDPREPNFETSPQVRYDFPLDPWGVPYRFYSPIGIIGTNASRTEYPNSLDHNFSDGLLTTDDDRDLERYAVVSWGRDQVPETNVFPINRDDIIHLFGSPGVESDFGLR